MAPTRASDVGDKIKSWFPSKPKPEPGNPSPQVAVTNQNSGGRFDLRAAALQTAMETTASFLSEPGLRKKLDGLRAKPAMDELRSALENNSQSVPAKFLENLLLQGGTKITREELKRNVVAALTAEAEKAANETMPSSSFDFLCKQMSVELAAALQKRLLPKYKKSGSSFVLAVGTFEYRTKQSLEDLDIKLEGTLKRVMNRLCEVDAIDAQFKVIAYDVVGANDLIQKIGGGDPKNWVREDGRNFMDTQVREYHPADIFVVEGELTEQIEESGCRRIYTVNAEVLHALSRVKVAWAEAKVVNLYHPTRHWLSEEQDAAIAPPPPTP